MKLLFCCAGTKAGALARWPSGGAARLRTWPSGSPVRRLADYAVVWAPPQPSWTSSRGSRAVFNIGAGVDALLKLRLPPTARVVRLDDAGMSVQMAEYVCHAVIRTFREFDGYEADVRQGRWSYRKPRSRADFAVG
jgi:glyoxylate/hydroxypyruvate reductase A